MEYFMMILVVGVFATLLMDFWQIVLHMTTKIPTTDWSLIARWLASFPKGGFQHKDIRKTPAKKAEGFLGMIFHYSMGLLFAALYLYLFSTPSWLNAVGFGLVTVVVPFFILQPGMGLGILASKHPRQRLFVIHTISSNFFYGAGLFLGFRIFETLGL